MTGFKQIRWTALAVLVVGLILAFGSGVVEKEAMKAPEGQFAHTATSMAGKLFTVASILILMWATEWQRAKLAVRLQKLEEELDHIKRGNAVPTAA
jgi:fumarate reductase subunit D